MNVKKKILLYVTLFITSMLISAFAVTAFADGQQSMEVTYHQLSAAEKNSYTVIIPSTLSLQDGEKEKTFSISVEDGYSLSDGYAIEVFLSKDCISEEGNVLKLYLNGDPNAVFYYAYNLYYGSRDILVESQNVESSALLAVIPSGIINDTMNGQCKIVCSDLYSTYEGNIDGGDYSGTMEFNIWCHN